MIAPPTLSVKLVFQNTDDLWAFTVAATANLVQVDIKNLILVCNFSKADTALAIKTYNACLVKSVVTM
jgi:hypothetical protein